MRNDQDSRAGMAAHYFLSTEMILVNSRCMHREGDAHPIGPVTNLRLSQTPWPREIIK